MRVLFIINPAAGANRASARWSAFEKQIRNSGLQMDRVFTTGPGHAAQLAREAAADHDVLVAAGGDGTVTEVASGILSARINRIALAILPLGTGNDLAESLGIRSPKEVLACLASGCTAQIDVLQVHCRAEGRDVVRHALLFAGVGIISEALRKTTPRLKRFLGQRLAYPAGLLRALMRYHSPQMTVCCNKQIYRDRFLFVAASNTPIAGGGIKIAPDARISDGLLNVNLIQTVGFCGAVLQLRCVCRGMHLNHPRVRYMISDSLEITSPDNLEVAADGELIGHTPARIIIRAGALKVMAPAGTERVWPSE